MFWYARVFVLNFCYLEVSLLQFAILYWIFFISIFIQLSVNRKDININKRRCITLAQRIKKVVAAPINTIPIILITKFSIHTMSTDSGTCSFVKSADTFYQFKQCQKHNYNNNENLSILVPFREKKPTETYQQT